MTYVGNVIKPFFFCQNIYMESVTNYVYKNVDNIVTNVEQNKTIMCKTYVL